MTIASRQDTGECAKKPKRYSGKTIGVQQILSCTKKEKHLLNGNNARFNLDLEDRNTLEIIGIDDKYCEPEQLACTCINLMIGIFNLKDEFGLRYKTLIEDLKAKFDASDYENSCICYLRAAYNVGFRFVQMTQFHNPREECTNKKHIHDQAGYIDICNDYSAANCGSNPVVITKE